MEENEKFTQVLPSHAQSAATWQEQIAYILAYEESPVERQMLLKELAQNLMKQKEIGAAIVCQILSGSVASVLDLWRKRASFQQKQMQSLEQKQYS